MRIEIDDSDAYRHQIDTADPELAGRWFAEKARLLMSANARYGECKLRIWPSTHEESKLIGSHDIRLTQDNLLALAQHILDASQQMADQENSDVSRETSPKGMTLFTCTCAYKFVVGRRRVFGPMFQGPGEHNAYWHLGRMMTREDFEDQYADCAYRFREGLGTRE